VNGARALIAANVLLVTIAIVLITLDRGPKDTSTDLSAVTFSDFTLPVQPGVVVPTIPAPTRGRRAGQAAEAADRRL
jgi:hypothetical protein